MGSATTDNMFELALYTLIASVVGAIIYKIYYRFFNK